MKPFPEAITAADNNYHCVVFRYVDETGIPIRTLPSVTLPTIGPKHAEAIAAAFNQPWQALKEKKDG